MVFYGFQKMTLLDYPGKVACTLFTGGCNLRCPFCHNAGLVTGLAQTEESSLVKEEEVLAFLKKRQGLLEGVCITGGEPLLHRELPAFIRSVRSLGYPVKLDTNGTFPDRLRALVEEGLVDYVAMDIKNSPEKYGITAGEPDLDLTPIRQSVAYLLEGHVAYEFRTTVLDGFHTPEDVAAIASWISGAPKYFLQNFEDSGHLLCPGLRPLPGEVLERMRAVAGESGLTVSLRGV
jgi:pyruvate formate lyase activating enzyme